MCWAACLAAASQRKLAVQPREGLRGLARALRELDRHTPSSDQFGGTGGAPVADPEPAYN